MAPSAQPTRRLRQSGDHDSAVTGAPAEVHARGVMSPICEELTTKKKTVPFDDPVASAVPSCVHARAVSSRLWGRDACVSFHTPLHLAAQRRDPSPKPARTSRPVGSWTRGKGVTHVTGAWKTWLYAVLRER